VPLSDLSACPSPTPLNGDTTNLNYLIVRALVSYLPAFLPTSSRDGEREEFGCTSYKGVSLGARVWSRNRSALPSPLAPTNDSWRVDETYIKVKGKDRYLDRAVDSQGNTLDFLLTAKRDAEAAKRFFRKALKAVHTQEPRVINEG